MELYCAAGRFRLSNGLKSVRRSMEQSIEDSPTLERVLQALQMIRDNENEAQVEISMNDLADFLDDMSSFDHFGVLEVEAAHKVVLKSMNALLLNPNVQRQGCFILSRLIDGSELIRLELETLQVHKFVLKIMESYPQDVCIQAITCDLITVLGCSERLCKDLIEENAVDLVLQSMEHFRDEEELQLPACQSLNQLLSYCDVKEQEIFVRKGKHTLITEIMNCHIDSGEILEPVCQLFCTLASSESTCRILSESQVFVLVLNVMKKHSLVSGVQVAGCQFLYRLCQWEVIDTLLVMQGAGEVALGALRQHRKNASVQSEALSLLKFITKAIVLQENKEIKYKHWLQDIFIAMATHGDQPRIQKVACQCICELIDSCPGLRAVIGDPDIDKDVNRVPLHSSIMAALMLHPDDVAVCQLACKSVSCIASNSDAIQEAFISKGVYLSLLKLMQQHPDVALIQQWCCNALRILCIGNIFNKKLLINCNAFEQVSKCLFSFSGNPGVQQEAIALIACWSTDIPLVRHQCAAEHIHLYILNSMRHFSGNVLLLEMAFEALGALSAAEEIPQLLVDAGVIGTILKIMQEHESEAAIQQKACVLIQVFANLVSDNKTCESVAKRVTESMCIYADNERVQIEACVALHVIAQIDAGKSETLVNSNAHERLFHILQNFPPDSQICDLASECLWFLGCMRDLKPRMLLTASASGSLCGAECLIHVGADVNAGEGNNTPLCFACMNDQAEMVKFLLTQGITDVQSALRLCLEMEHHTLVGLLLQHLGLDKEAGSLVWSGLNLGAVHPEWISPALLGADYSTPGKEINRRWSDLLRKGEESRLRRSAISFSITSLSSSFKNQSESFLSVGTRPGQESLVSLDSIWHKTTLVSEPDETIAEESDSLPSERADNSDSSQRYDFELTEVSLPRAESRSGASFPYSPYDPRVVAPFFRSGKVLLPRSAARSSCEDVFDASSLQSTSGLEQRPQLSNLDCYTGPIMNRSFNETERGLNGRSWSDGAPTLMRNSFSFDDAFYEAPDSDSESFTNTEEMPRKSQRLSSLPLSPLASPFQMPSNTYLCNFSASPHRRMRQRTRSCGVMSELGKSMLEGSESESTESSPRPSSRISHSKRKRATSPCVHLPTATVKHIDFSSNAIQDLQPLVTASHMLLLHLINVEKLDLSQNNLKYFPSKLCEAMPRLRHVSLKHNDLDQFPYCLTQNSQLNFLDLSHNNIDVLHRPPSCTFTSITIEHLDLSYNSLESFPEWFYEFLPGVTSLSLAGNRLECLPSSSLKLHRLKTLDISNNKLNEIHEAFLCECHCLESLNASCNLLKALPEMAAPCFPKLLRVRVAQNSLTDKAPFHLPRFLLNLQCLQVLDISSNGLTDLPEPMAWQSTQLKELNLAHNKIKKFPLQEGITSLANLERLNLSHNNLKRVPTGIGALSLLTSLNLSHNPNITSLPDEMGKLSHVFELQLDGLKLDLETSILESKTKDLIGYLHSKLRNSVPYYRVKVVLVGLSGRGKTAIRNLLLKEKHSGDGDVTVRDWNVRDTKARCNHCHKKCVNYTISLWDFKGHEDLYGLFQCLLSTRALYLAVYDITKGPEEIARLKPWLLNIQACAPGAPVILVGTHHDKVLRECNDSLLKSMKDTAKKLCSNPGFPEIRGHIVLDAQHESAGVQLLRNKVMELIVRCKCVGHALVGTQVPRNFVRLQDIFMEKALSRRNSGLPVLRKAEVKRLMEERDVVMEEAEMSQAVRFLHEAGVVVHLDDPVMQLSDMYFVDPEWLCHLIAKVVASRDTKQCPVTNGVIQRSDVHNLVEKDKGNVKLPTSMVPQFLRLLVRLGILLPLSPDEFLIPTKLGSRRPSICLPGWGPDAFIQRQYEMAYIPIGFWPRLTTRLLHFLRTLFSDKKNLFSMEMKPRIQYWCEGIYVQWPGNAFFLILPSRVTSKSSVVEITVPNSKYGYRILGDVVDHMDALLEEWFPGLCGVDPVYGLPLIKRLVPCVVCHDDQAHFFTLDECIQESAFDEYVICPKTAQSIPIQRVAPDVVLGDLDEQFLINEYELTLVESPESRLGNGAFGAVYRAKYRKSSNNEDRSDDDDDDDDEDLITNPNKTVAVKVFHGAQDSTPHRMLRQEVTFLHRLRHPSIISLVGACLRPSRALVLELAPLGSLSSQLKKEQPLSRGLQHRISMQIAEGLAFLHKNMIVYRDLKPHNILIFSLSLGILVNAKISDYGIARYATLYGLTASEGTPGYRAPEVARGDVAYNKEADMYSYGMFLYELVTGGRKPFEDLHFRNQLDAAVVQGRAMDPITASGCAPWPDVEDLLAHLLDPQPENRPTAEEVYERLCMAEFLCLKRAVAVCKGQTVECMAVRHFVDKGGAKLEVWVGSGLSGDRSGQVSWLNLTDRHTEGCQGTMLKDRRVKCMAAVHSDIVLVGTQSGTLWVFEAGCTMQHKCLHSLPRLPDAVLCLKHYTDARTGLDLVFAGLANGQLAIYDARNLKQPDLQPSLMDLRPEEKASKERKEKRNETEEIKVAESEMKETEEVRIKNYPVACIVNARRRLFCGCGNDVVVLQFGKDGKLEIERRWSVEDCQKGLVLNIAVGSLVWVSTKDSTQLDTWEPSQAIYRGSVDCKVILETSGNTQAAHDIRVVSVLLQQRKRQLWIGLGSGHVILIDPTTKGPLRIIRRHVSAVRCIESCSGPAFGKPLSLVMTGGMGFIEGPMCSENKSNVDDFGHVLIWEADVRAQIMSLESYRKKRQEYVSSNRLSGGGLRRKSVVDLHDIGCQSLVHLRRKSVT